MKTGKKRWITYLVAAAIAALMVLLSISMEIETCGTEPAPLTQAFSNGFFLAAVLYLGCGALTFISEAGNFYGIQFLGYTMVRLFSVRKERFADRKDYFTYCTEKQAKQQEKGKASAKWVMLQIGLVCLILSGICAVLYYRMMEG